MTTRFYGVYHTNPYITPPKSRSDVYCFKLNFNISIVGYSDLLARIFRTWRRQHVFASDWFIGLSVSVVIGHSDYFDLASRHLS